MKPKNILSLSLVFLFTLGFFSCKKEESSPAAQIKEPLPVDIALRYVQGVEGLGSLAILRIFSRKLLQQDMDKLHQLTGEDKQNRSLFWPEKNWSENLIFLHAVGNDSEFQKLEIKFQVLSAPDQEELIFEPGRVFEAIYEFETSEVLQPGSLLMAEMRSADSTVRSNDVEVPASPSDKEGQILQKMNLLLLSGKDKELQAAAEEAISGNPNDHSGYWYLGLSLENTGENRAALAAFTLALEKYPIPSKDEFFEPPMRLVEKIRDISKKIQNPLQK
ncbi:MAG: hypothetical protein MUP98_17740 [Candidatus Aminicenantes bacterium]|nr:hypothetical protein [Candidatus Aminicenantes bacterium]